METHTRSQFATDLAIVYNILTIDFRSFHALRTWKVHVVMFSYHATHFSLTAHVRAPRLPVCILTIDFRSFHALRTWKVHVVMFSYHTTHFLSLLTCAPLDFRYVNARFDFRHAMVISHIAYASRLPLC